MALKSSFSKFITHYEIILGQLKSPYYKNEFSKVPPRLLNLMFRKVQTVDNPDIAINECGSVDMAHMAIRYSTLTEKTKLTIEEHLDKVVYSKYIIDDCVDMAINPKYEINVSLSLDINKIDYLKYFEYIYVRIIPIFDKWSYDNSNRDDIIKFNNIARYIGCSDFIPESIYDPTTLYTLCHNEKKNEILLMCSLMFDLTNKYNLDCLKNVEKVRLNKVKEIKPKKIKEIKLKTVKEIKQNKKKKKTIPKKIKQLVWNKYIGADIGTGLCLCCKYTKISQMDFQCGHDISEKNGGKIIVSNLRPICSLCNSSMGTTNMFEFMEEHGL